MQSVLKAAAFALVFSFAGIGGASAQTPAPADFPTADSVLAEWNKVYPSIQAQKYEDAYAPLKALVAAPGFEGLTTQQQHTLQMVFGGVAVEAGHSQEGLESIQKATASSLATADDWQDRFTAAVAADDEQDAVATLTHIARVYPSTLSAFEDDDIFGRFWRAAKLDPEHDAQTNLLEAMFDAGWTPKSPFTDLSFYHVVLARELLARGETAKARRVLNEPLDRSQTIRVRIDRRFDPIVQAHLADFDVAAAANRMTDKVRQAVDANPRKLNGVDMLASRLAEAGRDQEELTLLDDAIARLAADPKAFDDPDELNWVLDYRARALKALGRYDEAVAARKQAAARPENGGQNVSQTINLGDLLYALGRSQEAIDAVASMAPGNTSKYGWMEAQLVRVCGYSQLGDAASMQSRLADMKSHEADNPTALEEALLCADDEPAAAALYVRRLGNPDQRLDALLALQDYDGGLRTPIERQMQARLDAVKARPEVQAAVAKVGRIEHQPGPRPSSY